MRTLRTTASLVMPLVILVAAAPAVADESTVKDATRQVESGAKTIGEGVKETAKGVGNTVVEGAKKAGDKLDEAGKAAEPKAKNAWEHVRDGATAFGGSVKSFFVRLFND